MANAKISALEGGELIAPADGDLLAAVDISEASEKVKTKYVKRSTLVGYTFLTTPLTSTNWDGDARSDESATKLDMSAVFTGYPTTAIKAVLVRVAARDSAAIGTAGIYFSVGPSATYYYAAQANPPGGDVLSSNTAWVPCDANGDIYYKIEASGSGTCDCWLEVWGYFI